MSVYELDGERFYEFCRKHYFRIYRVSLVFSRYHTDRLFRVYEYGINNRVGLVTAVEAIFGYRYRRMENFARECGVWRGGWVCVKTIITVSINTGERTNVSSVFNAVGFLPIMGIVSRDNVFDFYSSFLEYYVDETTKVICMNCPKIVGVEQLLDVVKYEFGDVGRWNLEFMFVKGFASPFVTRGLANVVNFYFIEVYWGKPVLREGYYEFY